MPSDGRGMFAKECRITPRRYYPCKEHPGNDQKLSVLLGLASFDQSQGDRT